MDYLKEKQEAIEAGERALDSLREARRQISGAKGFGIWDIFGGGSLVSIAKHFKISNARRALDCARNDLRSFSKELRDVSMNIDIEIGDFLTLFDIFDSFLADVIVQSRLSDAGRRIDEAISKVSDCLNRLRLS
ncbi:MAG: hypothetical protein J5785_04010 [Spirochaetales bacterium]|nr:hypothetical protein [Spirochaetales bacterium]